jgi:uncharacterized membrane protein
VLAKTIAVASLAWLVLLGAAWWRASSGPAPGWAAVIYAAASRVCHQKPERSFHPASTQWPVCARCSGLYDAAPIGAIAALIGRRARRGRKGPGSLPLLIVAAIPTALTWLLEVSGTVAIGNVARFLAALPLGAAIAWVLVRTATPATID